MQPRHPDSPESSDFIREIIDRDLQQGRNTSVVVRFPPEPNGYLHIGHAKSITLNFGLARDYGGACNLRFDDTNPETEDLEYVEAIKRDLKWLGFDWEDREYYASDYFGQLYDWAVALISKGLAYVDDLSEDDIRAFRGTVTEPGRESPFRGRSVKENLDLFARMRAGEFADGDRVLRARIDMAHPNMKMRDPLMYRIRHASHYRQGSAWCIYPFYDWAHGQSDAIEGVTHSICTLEFAVNRPLYDWYLDALGISPRPRQYEFARMNLGYSVTSKRKLRSLVRLGHVKGWDDPRMPTLAGIRRRGVPPAAVRRLCELVGTTRVDGISDPDLLDHCIRKELNFTAPRVMCVLDPLRVTLTNYEGAESLDAPHWPHDVPREGTRAVPFSGSLLVERSDFEEHPPKGFRRLSPGAYVRLRHAYIIRCDEVIRNDHGDPVELLCTYFPETKSGTGADGPKARGTIHWVDANGSIPAEVRLYDRLFLQEAPGDDFMDALNPASSTVHRKARIEPSVRRDAAEVRYQFTRLGYFWRDPSDSDPDAPVFCRITPLRDSWAKSAGKRKHSGRRAVASPGPATGAPRRGGGAARTGSADPAAAVLAVAGADSFLVEAKLHGNPDMVTTWMVQHLLPALDGRDLGAVPITPQQLAEITGLVQSGKLSTHQARRVLRHVLTKGGTVKAAAGLTARESVIDPEALGKLVDDVVARYPDKAAAYRNGKSGLLNFFVGQVMRGTSGKAAPELTRRLLRARLED